MKNWKKQLGKAWDIWEEIQVEENKHKSSVLKFIDNVMINKRAWNVDGTENGKWISRLKLGDLGKWEREGKRCAVCGNITKVHVSTCTCLFRVRRGR